MICEHRLTEFCRCISPRPVTYVLEGHWESWLIWRRDARLCTCEPANREHRSGADCFKRAQVADFMRAHPDLKTPGHARALMYIETFAPARGGESPKTPHIELSALGQRPGEMMAPSADSSGPARSA